MTARLDLDAIAPFVPPVRRRPVGRVWLAVQWFGILLATAVGGGAVCVLGWLCIVIAVDHRGWLWLFLLGLEFVGGLLLLAWPARRR